MFLLADLLFVLLLFISIYLAGKKGFVGLARGLVVLVAAVLLAVFGNKALAGIVRDTTIGDGIYAKMEISIGGLLGITPETENAVAENLIQNGNNTILAIDSLTSGSLLAGLRGQISAGAEDLASRLLYALADTVTGLLLRVIAFVTIFLLGYIGLRLGLRFLRRATQEKGLVGYVNTALGLAVGTVRGLVLCIVLANLGVWLMHSIGTPRGWDVPGLLSQTYLFRFFSNVFAFL